jgi:hypothetical protein
MYLRGFLDPLEEAKKQHVLWLYEIARRPRRVSVRNIGGEDGFYAYEDGGMLHTELEDKLAEMERAAAPTLKKLRSGVIALSAQERDEFATFIALTLARVRFYSDLTDKFAAEAHREFVNAYLNNPQFFEKCRRDYEQSSGENLPTTFEEMKEFLEKVSSGEIAVTQTSRGWTIKIMMESVLDLSPLFENMSWGLLRAPRHELFLTTDNPVVVVDAGKSLSKESGVIYSDQAFFTFPISREYCLQGINRRAGDGTQPLRPSEVHEINKMLIGAAYRFIYSPMKAAFIEKNFKKIHDQKGPLLPDPPKEFF